MTVTATESGFFAPAGGNVGLCVKVLTGATQSGQTGTSFTATPSGAGPNYDATLTLTPNASGSLLFGSVSYQDPADQYVSADAGTTSLGNVNLIAAGSIADFMVSSSATVAATPQATGLKLFSSPAGINHNIEIVVAEIEGTGLAIDASSPAIVTASATAAVTASFSPPSGAVLVAMCAASSRGGGMVTLAVTDSTGAYTWTRLISQQHTGGGFQYNDVWAGIPAGTTASAGRGTATAAVLTTLAALGGLASLVTAAGSALNAFVTTAGGANIPGRSIASVGEAASCIAAVTGNGSRASVSGYGSSASVS